MRVESIYVGVIVLGSLEVNRDMIVTGGIICLHCSIL